MVFLVSSVMSKPYTKEFLQSFVGKKVHSLTVLDIIDDKENRQNGQSRYRFLCKCDCGNTTTLMPYQVAKGTIKTCGCQNGRIQNRDCLPAKLFAVWHNMIAKCENPKSAKYYMYGARGIEVCKEWHDYLLFREWALANGYNEGLSIDRIDNNGNYEPANCRWTTMKVQSLNKRSTIFITYKGETKTLMEWCEVLSLPYPIIYNRYYKWKDGVKALTYPYQPMKS